MSHEDERSNCPTEDSRRFAGVARLYGPSAWQTLVRAHVVVVGIGGVGSWAVEALARSGVGTLTLIDLDHVAESNVNRQVHAVTSELGKAKVFAMRDRIAQIAPECRVFCVEDFVTPDNVAHIVPRSDVLIDCIDQVRAKAALVAWASAMKQSIIVCGAGGGRTDPTRIARGDLGWVQGDPLLAKLRYQLRKQYGFKRGHPDKRVKWGVTVVYSDEPVRKPHGGLDAGVGLACAGYGSSVTVTASLGFAAAAWGMDQIVRV